MQCEDAVKSFLKAFAETCSGKKALHKIKSLKGERWKKIWNYLVSNFYEDKIFLQIAASPVACMSVIWFCLRKNNGPENAIYIYRKKEK